MTPQTGGTNIGYPLASDCWVVRPSNHNHLMPIGAVGEVLIGGPKLARGYLKNPEETSRAFLTDPPPWQHAFRDPATSSMRLYKTGDLARYGSNGALHFVGRKDMQIKLRGQRLEPAEIEAAINRLLPRGSHAVVDAITRSCDRSTALAAFIVVASDNVEPARLPSAPVENLFVIPSPAVQDQLGRINQALAQELPKFMVPSRYFVLARMPLAVSEKLDRRKLKQCAEALSDEDLRRLTSSSASSIATRRPAANRSEEILVQACTSVLSRRPETIGLDDSFFDLGGDSIIAISLTQEARRQGLSFEVFDVFRHPRLSDLAAASTVVDEGSAQSTEISTGFVSYFGFQDEKDLEQAVSGAHIPTHRISQVLPATEMQAAELHDPFHHFTFHLNGPLDPSRLDAACQRLVDRHEILRTVFLQVHGRVCQAILDSVDTVVYQRDCFRTKSLAEYVSMVCRENDLPPPAFGAPITKFTLVNGLSDKRVLIIRLSHAQYDGYFLRLLIRELKALYEGGTELPDPVPFSSFIHHWYWQQSNRDALRFWTDHLRGGKMTLIPGQSESRYPRAHEEGRSITVSVTSTEPVRLLPIEGVTLATIVEATWIIILGRLTQQRDLTFGVVTSGRNSGSQSDYLGCCINPISLRTIVNPDWTVRELLLTVQKWYIDSMPFEHLQLEAITASDLGLDQAPFGTVVIVQNTEPNREFDIDGISCRAGRLGPLPNRPYLIVEAIPDESHRVSLRLTGAAEVLSGHQGQTMIKELAQTLVRVGSDPGQHLSQLGLPVHGS